MAVYSFRCGSCDAEFDRHLPMSEYNTPQYCECGAKEACEKLIVPVGFILKGDGWSGKNLKIKNQMAKRRSRLATKENEIKRDAPSVTLAPNVGGEQVANWTEAKKLAASKGKDTSTYDSMIRKEKAGSA